jgi:exonuclease III/ribonuclease HI
LARPFADQDEEHFHAMQLCIEVPGSHPRVSFSNDVPPLYKESSDLGYSCEDCQPQAALNMSSQASPETNFFAFDANAPVFVPGAVAWQIDDVHLDTLATQWLAAARSWDESVPSARFITWRVAPAVGRRYCLDSRDVVLYGDMDTWRQRILGLWADQQDPMVSSDIISVSPHPSNLEPGVAGHIIIQQHSFETHAPVIVTVVDPAVNDGLRKRQVHVLEDGSRPQDVLFFVGYSLDCPRIADCIVSLRDRVMPPSRPIQIRDGDAFEIDIQRTHLPDNWLPPTIPRLMYDDETGLLQTATMLRPSRPKFKRHGYEDEGNFPWLICQRTTFQWQLKDALPSGDSQCSLTEEFIRAARSIRDVQEAEPAPTDNRAVSLELHPTIQELWELSQTQLASSGQSNEPSVQIQTWFLDHVTLDRCYISRLVSLLPDPSTWYDAILQIWADKREFGARVEIALVYPEPDDIDSASLAQLIITQHPQEDLRSLVLSVYDTSRDSTNPRTFAFVHGTSLSLSSVLEEVRLTRVCPPHVRHNECALWFGSTAIPTTRQVFVRTGNAFCLSIRRGLPVSLQTLLTLPDSMLRRHLQEAIWGEIYQRPAGPGFPGDVYDTNPLPRLPTSSSQSESFAAPSVLSHQPQWIDTLNFFFSHHAATEQLEEGPVLYIQTWFVHGQNYLWCREPQAVRLTRDVLTWRQTITAAWQDRLDRAAPAEFWTVQPDPPFSIVQGMTIHLIVSQQLETHQTAVLLTAVESHAPVDQLEHAAYALPRDTLADDIARSIVPPWHRSSVIEIVLDGRAFSLGVVVRLHSGASVVARYGQYDRGRQSEESEGMMLLQKGVRVSSVSTVAEDTFPLHHDASHCAPSSCPISIFDAIEPTTADIEGIPFSLGVMFGSDATRVKPLHVCVWEMPKSCSETALVMQDQRSADLCNEFRRKHDFLRPVSQLFDVQFVRHEWNIQSGQIRVGSYQVPPEDRAIVFCIRYQPNGAVYSVRTLPSFLDLAALRKILNVKFGSFVRCNGLILFAGVHLHHGDVLEYHAAPGHEGLSFSLSCSRVQLCLEASLPSPVSSFDENGDATLLLQHPQLISALSDNAEWTFVRLPEGLDLHPATFEALHLQQEIEHPVPVFFELYVDGATSAPLSAWAVVAVAVTPTGRIFYGCISGITQIRSAHDEWIGAQQHSNIDAELTAMTVATAFALFAQHDYAVVVRPDLALSRQIAQSVATTRQSSPLAKTLHALGQLASNEVFTQEVRAHCNDPWNELADRLAKWTVQHGSGVGTVPWTPLHLLASSSTDCSWGWLPHAPGSFQAALPHLHEGAIWQPPQSAHVIPIQTDAAQPVPSTTQVAFKVVTFNALALDESDEAMRLPGPRTTRVDQQFHSHECAIVGLQETRTREGRRTTDHYAIFSSGFAQCWRSKHYGCELWLHKTLPLAHDANGHKITISDFRVTIAASDPRWLLARLQGPFELYVLVAHAPCLTHDRPIDQLISWWTALGGIISRVPSNAIFVCALDANAPLADTETKFFGQHQAEPINRQGQAFQEFLISQELFAPATFTWHSGTAATWRHPAGNLLRRDYVLVNAPAFAMVDKSCVLSDFDSGFGHQDHVPVMLSFQGFLATTPPAAKLRWDYAKMASPQARAAFEQALHTLPMSTWTTDVDAHSKMLETNIVQLAQQHIGTPPKTRNRPVLSELTRNCISLKRQALNMLRTEGMNTDLLLLQELKTFERVLRPMVLQDQKCWYAAWLDDINTAARRFDSAQVYTKLQRLGRRRKSLEQGPRPLPKLLAANGCPAQSFEECQQIWCDQFGQLEAGLHVDSTQLSQLHGSGALGVTADPTSLMSAHDILAAIRCMRSGKVPGPGKLPIDILKAGGFTLAQVLLPLMTKAAWHMHEPLSWKGGLLVPLFKGKGSPQHAQGYRSIFISDVCGKIHHAHVRQALVQEWTQHEDVIQQGGRKGCSTDIAHHLLHSYFAWARSHSTSCAMLFVDLHAAFYTVIRSLLLDEQIHDDLLCQAMQRLGITPQDWHNILGVVQTENAAVGLDKYHKGVLADMFAGTHFIMPGVDRPVATFRGTRPGDPVADVLFNMAFRLIVLDARAKFQHASTLTFLGTPQTASDLAEPLSMPDAGFTEITFVDDIAYALHAPTARQVVSSLQLVASCLHDAATARGMQLNYGAGKTEAMIFCAGAGSRGVRRQIWHDMHGFLPIITEQGMQSLRLVHVYKHLGSFLQCQAVVHKEVSYRVSQAKKAFGQLSRPFYCKRNVGLRTKTAVFSALVCARHAYNAHTWAWITEDDLCRWENGLKDAVSKLAAPLIRPIPAFAFTVGELCGLLELSCPIDLLHANRLRYVKRAIAHAPQLLWQLVNATHSTQAWLPAIQKSFQWFLTHFAGKFALPVHDVWACLQLVALDERWNGKVKKALQSATRHRTAAAQGKLWTLKIERSLQLFAEDQLFPTAESHAQWQCAFCDEAFETKRGLAIHARHKHGYTKVLKYYVLSDECLACGKKFFQRSRALAHVTAVSRCRDAYLSCFVPAAEDIVANLAAEDLEYARLQKQQGWRATKAFLPLSTDSHALPARARHTGCSDYAAKMECQNNRPRWCFSFFGGLLYHVCRFP